MTNVPRKRIFGLDALRAVSMLLIMMYHYTTRYQESIGHAVPWPVSVPWGCYAVNTFFVLTGYLTFANLKRGSGSFLKKRVIRLYPTFLVSVLLTSFFMALLMPERLRSVKDILLNLTMFPSKLGAQSVDGVYWTLEVELLFYIWVSLIALPKSQRWQKIALGSWILVATSCFILRRVGIESLPVKLTGFVTLANSRFEFLAAGSLLALLPQKQGMGSIPVWMGMLLCGIIAFLDMGWSHGVLWLVLTLLCIMVAVKIPFECNNAVTKLLVWLAQISYPVYLIHQNIGFAVMKKLDALGLTSQLYIAIPIALTLLLGTILHRYVELPEGRRLLAKQNL